MSRTSALIATFVALAFSGLVAAQGTPQPAPAAPAAAPVEKAADAPTAQSQKKVYHAGGKHDQYAHERSEKAKANGKTMQESAVHAGGRHDEQSHKAAIKAQQSEAAATEATKK